MFCQNSHAIHMCKSHTVRFHKLHMWCHFSMCLIVYNLYKLKSQICPIYMHAVHIPVHTWSSLNVQIYYTKCWYWMCPSLNYLWSLSIFNMSVINVSWYKNSSLHYAYSTYISIIQGIDIYIYSTIGVNSCPAIFSYCTYHECLWFPDA